MIPCKMKMKTSLKKVSWFQAGVYSPCPPHYQLLTSCLWDVQCFHSIKPSLAAATFPPDLGHVSGQRDAALGRAKFGFTLMTQIHPESFSPRWFLMVTLSLCFA